MNPENKKLVIFDFDGVLVNTIDFCLTELKNFNSHLTLEKFRDFSNGNFHEFLTRNEKENNFCIPDNWTEIYNKNIKNLTITDVLDNLIKLLSENYILAIVSSSYNDSINRFLVQENIQKYFTDILGADIHRSKVVKIKSILEKYNIKPENSVFITDSLGDILEGNECHVSSIGVTWGIHERGTLEKGNPIRIIDDPRDLLEAIQNVLK